MSETKCPYCESDLIATGVKYNGWIKCYCNTCHKEFVLNDSMVSRLEYKELVKQVLKMQSEIEYLQAAVLRLQENFDDADYLGEGEDE